MFGKVKKWLGIEGVKLELDLPETAFKQVEAVTGKIRFYSKNAQEVTGIKVQFIEKYSRGRGDDKRIDEYQLGEIEFNETIQIPEEEMIEIEFTLPFSMMQSAVDTFGDRNILTSGLATLAKSLNSVQSQYFVEAEAKVTGTALSPFDRQSIDLQ
ncbi:MAG: sporulation-control protein spo0M [Saprospiraceae bacterium]|jgi:sporulation-control protein spo0M